MDSRRFLPSRQFTLIVVSLALSGGLVVAADHITRSATPSSVAVDTTAATPPSTTDWQSELAAVQGSSGVSLPQAPDQTTIEGLLQAAKSSNLTDTVSRSLFVNLMNAKGQGLGDDTPTQDQIVQAAASQVSAAVSDKTYTADDIVTVANTKAALHAYGNSVIKIFTTNSDQEFAKTLVIMNAETGGGGDSGKLGLLPSIQAKYTLIEGELATLPVPKTLEPFHLQLLNDYGKIAATYDGMESVKSDPLGALAALQQYQTLTQDVEQMFINIAQALNKNDILFTTDEPGNTWSLLLQAQQQ